MVCFSELFLTPFACRTDPGVTVLIWIVNIKPESKVKETCENELANRIGEQSMGIMIM